MSRKKNKLPDIKLDAYELEIENALPDNLEALPITENLSEELAFAKEASENYLRKNAKINIRISQFDLQGLKRIAAKEGLPYQTLISSILHKYIVGHLNR